MGRFGRAGLSALKEIRVIGGELSNFKHAGVFGFGSYRELKTAVGTGSGLHVHHLIEKRFASEMGQKANNMLSIVLNETEHAVFTKAWRKQIAYGVSATREEIETAARTVYKDYPGILNALGLH